MQTSMLSETFDMVKPTIHHIIIQQSLVILTQITFQKT